MYVSVRAEHLTHWSITPTEESEEMGLLTYDSKLGWISESIKKKMLEK